MRKILATIAVAAVAAFGLSSCSSPEALKEEVAVESTAPAEETTSGSDVPTDLQVCLELSALLADASAAMQSSDSNGEDVFIELANTFGTLAANASNTEVKNAALAVQADLVATQEAQERVLAGDVNAVQDVLDAQANFQKSYSALLGICVP